MSTEDANNNFNNLERELQKVSEKIDSFEKLNLNFTKIENDLLELKDQITQNSQVDHEKVKNIATITKSKVSELIKAHREVHVPLSKFGKNIDKTCVNNIEHLSSYFEGSNGEKRAENDEYFDQNFSLVLIDHLLRFGNIDTAKIICQDLEIDESEIDFDRFIKINQMINTVEQLDFESPRKWAMEKSLEIGKFKKNLDYSLAKLDFLLESQTNPENISKILEKAKALVPFSDEFSSDFEHVMGSLTYLGKNLEDTPYEDLCIVKKAPQEAMEVDNNQEAVRNGRGNSHCRKFFKTFQNPSDSLCLDKKFLNYPNVLARFVQTFRIIISRQAGLSHIDPLFVAFSAGCRVLPKLHSLKLVMASIGKFNSSDANTLPIAVELDPIAIKHNIFHCPVIKEVNDNPIRLCCGHAISRDAFNSLASGERNKVKCPYCPTETPRSRVLHLYF